MLKRLIIAACVMLIGAIPNANAAVTVEDMTGAIKKDLRHPYLYFSEEDKPAMLERIKNVPEYRDILNRKLAAESGSGMASWYRTNFFGGVADIFDIIWPESGVEPVAPDHESHYFSSIDWAVLRSDFTSVDRVTVACKAGFHNDPHHGHLDCGTFTIQWHDREFISEAGLRGYDEPYFHEARWKSPQASSVGHNVVFVNGELQIPAKLKNQPWREGIGGRILEFRSDDSRDYVRMDPTNAYPGKELKGWKRHIILEKPVITVVLDEIESAKGAEIKVRFHLKCSIDTREKFTLLEDGGNMMALIPVMKSKFTFNEDRHAFLRVRLRGKHRRLYTLKNQ